jgi:hypothetical protein
VFCSVFLFFFIWFHSCESSWIVSLWHVSYVSSNFFHSLCRLEPLGLGVWPRQRMVADLLREHAWAQRMIIQTISNGHSNNVSNIHFAFFGFFWYFCRVSMMPKISTTSRYPLSHHKSCRS